MNKDKRMFSTLGAKANQLLTIYANKKRGQYKQTKEYRKQNKASVVRLVNE